ncbi:MAG TPA: hypothetical protein VL598_13335 [Trinickia sp.]|jgi:hypothetical protein|uniref:hypothetical protein n=1 Tax=Trinickia sp. TaxID=2571163 RepID=UPI002CCF9ECF|nr:hypothetical protein [Trinickia sp.]HTI18643.1 hypothetical protein [Trinickia sp.]
MDSKQVIKALTDSDWSHSSIGNKAIIQAAIELLGARRGTDEQIQLERKLTCEAIDGAIAFGYQNMNPPPSDDHWLAPFWKIGRKQAELEAAALHSDAAQAPIYQARRRRHINTSWTDISEDRVADYEKSRHHEVRKVYVAPGAAAQGEAATTGVIAAAEALIAADRVCALTDEHVNALENAIAIQRGNVALPAAAQGEVVRVECEWTYVGDPEYAWNTGCGEKWAFTDDGPKENGMHFCHSCGGKLTIKSDDRAAPSTGDLGVES